MSYHVAAKEQHSSQFMFTRIIVCLLLAMISARGLPAADFAMKVTDKNYLDTQGFSVFLYDSTYHPVFVDQKNTAMEMILHGQRIATNGDVRLMPTPEQWDLVATLKGSPCRQGEQPAQRRPRVPDVRLQLHTGSRSGTRRREGQHQSRQTATAETGGAGGLQPRVPALDLHGQGLSGGRNQSRHFPAHAERSDDEGFASGG